MQEKQAESEKNIKPFSKTCWLRLVKQYQGLVLKTSRGDMAKTQVVSSRCRQGQVDACSKNCGGVNVLSEGLKQVGTRWYREKMTV